MHLGEDRLTIFQRPFSSIEEQDKTIIHNWNSLVSPEDTVWVLGDVLVDVKKAGLLGELNGHKHLIIGNYDEDKLELLSPYFESVQEEAKITMGGLTYYLNHYPVNARPDMFSIVGHIHSLWKVQRNMVNVSTDAWNFKPASQEQIELLRVACDKYYDINVFAGELPAQISGSYQFTELVPTMPIKKRGFTIFLAGPTPRGGRTELSWRVDFVKQLREASFTGTIINPELADDADYDYVSQVSWEDEGLNVADLIVFWIPRDMKNMPALTTNIEFGEWMSSGKCILGYPETAEKMRYLQSKAVTHSIPVVHTTEELIGLIMNAKKKFDFFLLNRL